MVYGNMSREALQTAVKSGDTRAMLELGFRCLKGVGEERNYSKGETLLVAAANAGNVEAQILLGIFYYQGKDKQDSEKPDYTKALYYFEQAASRGHAGAMNAAAACRDEMKFGAAEERYSYSQDDNLSFVARCGVESDTSTSKKLSERQLSAFRRVIEKTRKTKAGERDYLKELGWVGVLGIVSL